MKLFRFLRALAFLQFMGWRTGGGAQGLAAGPAEGKHGVGSSVRRPRAVTGCCAAIWTHCQVNWGLSPGHNPTAGSVASLLKWELLAPQLNTLMTSVVLPPCLKLPFARALTLQFTALGTQDGGSTKKLEFSSRFYIQLLF